MMFLKKLLYKYQTTPQVIENGIKIDHNNFINKVVDNTKMMFLYITIC